MSPSSRSPGSEWDRYLAPDEQILWQGRPAPGISWRGGEMGTVLLGGFILAFLAFFFLDVWLSSDGSPVVEDDFSPWGILLWLVLAVVLALSGPLGMRMVRRGTWYTLTDRRAIIAHWPRVFGITVYRGLDSYPVSDVEIIRSDLRGFDTVNFAWLSQRQTFDDGWRRVPLNGRAATTGAARIRNHRIGFERITGAERLAALCRAVQAGSRSPDPGDV